MSDASISDDSESVRSPLKSSRKAKHERLYESIKAEEFPKHMCIGPRLIARMFRVTTSPRLEPVKSRVAVEDAYFDSAEAGRGLLLKSGAITALSRRIPSELATGALRSVLLIGLVSGHGRESDVWMLYASSMERL